MHTSPKGYKKEKKNEIKRKNNKIEYYRKNEENERKSTFTSQSS